MKSKTTLILLVITAAVFAYMFFYERKALTTEEAKRQAQNVVNFSREKIDGIVIQNGDDKIDRRRRDKKWRLETPIKEQADSSLIENLLLDLESGQNDASIPPKEMEANNGKQNEYSQ